MSPRTGTIVFAGAALIIAAGLLRAAARLPVLGTRATPYASAMNARAPRERQASNVPTAITFDYRGLDTLGEEIILFAALAGVTRTLKHGRRRATARHEDDGTRREVSRDPSAAVRALARVLGAGTLVLGTEIVVHGHLTPGSGFQGGVVLSAAWLLVYLGFGARLFRRLTADAPTDMVASVAAGAYALVAVGGLLAGGALLTNVLPLGTLGQLASTGTIAVIDVAVGCEVAASFALLYAHFLDVARTEPARRPG